MVFFEKLTHQSTAILLLLLRLTTTLQQRHSTVFVALLLCSRKKQLDLEIFSEFPETPECLSSEFHV